MSGREIERAGERAGALQVLRGRLLGQMSRVAVHQEVVQTAPQSQSSPLSGDEDIPL